MKLVVLWKSTQTVCAFIYCLPLLYNTDKLQSQGVVLFRRIEAWPTVRKRKSILNFPTVPMNSKKQYILKEQSKLRKLGVKWNKTQQI